MKEFFKVRWNRDNFLNLMFSLGFTVGFSIVFKLIETLNVVLGPLVTILSCITIIMVPWIIKRKSNIIFDKDNPSFVTGTGNRFKTSGSEFILIVLLSCVINVLVGFIFDGMGLKDSPFILTIMLGFFFFIPALYCIIRNINIAAFFKKEAWNDKVLTMYGNKFSSNKNNPYVPIRRSKSPSRNRDCIVTSPAYRYMSCNIHHR